ncbi:hypothetical protein EK21DRAFT_116122 [Setomelanomma holmii]|uniref:Uncharacterized protein n=1 Tax=Setomelanomma holmii TaxID=210430 RepID=A0A9P4LI44_9PLEO|nr:hypothetical protein EK21DRAFT_116122 [Setomelanomma holmii]
MSVQERMNFIKQELESLRLLRNAHAHEQSDFDAKHIVALLDDLYLVAVALELHILKPSFERYKSLLVQFEEKVRRDDFEKLRKIEIDHRDAQVALELKEAELSQELKRVGNEQRSLRAKMVQMAADVRLGTLANAGKQLKDFTIEREVSRLLRLVSAPRRMTMMQSLQDSLTTTTHKVPALALSETKDAENDSLSVFYRLELKRDHIGKAENNLSSLAHSNSLMLEQVDDSHIDPNLANDQIRGNKPRVRKMISKQGSRFTMPSTIDEEAGDVDLSFDFLRGDGAVQSSNGFADSLESDLSESLYLESSHINESKSDVNPATPSNERIYGTRSDEQGDVNDQGNHPDFIRSGESHRRIQLQHDNSDYKPNTLYEKECTGIEIELPHHKLGH